MSLVEFDISTENTLSPRQRVATYATIALVFVGLYFGYSIHQSAITKTTSYTNVQAGLNALYPESWLLDETGDYVFRVRNMANRGFKTVIQVQTQPVSSDVFERNLLDQLTLSRSQFLIDYNVLGYGDFVLPNDDSAIAMNYTFVARDTSPFLEGISSVVVGLDLLTIQRGQAIIITFRADSMIYEQELSTFYQFLENLNY
jgi:hypothetical protein